MSMLLVEGSEHFFRVYTPKKDAACIPQTLGVSISGLASHFSLRKGFGSVLLGRKKENKVDSGLQVWTHTMKL
jgi:hypothetical protein